MAVKISFMVPDELAEVYSGRQKKAGLSNSASHGKLSRLAREALIEYAVMKGWLPREIADDLEIRPLGRPGRS